MINFQDKTEEKISYYRKLEAANNHPHTYSKAHEQTELS